MIQFENAVKYYSEIILSELNEQGVNCWVAGGCVRDYFMGKPIKTDYDIFFPDENNFTKAKEYLTEKGAEIKWESDNGCKFAYKGRVFDLVKKYFNTPSDTINAFDFTVSMFAVDIENVFHGETSFIDLSKRQLIFNKITYEGSTLSRAFRYYKKGFQMCNSEMKKLYDAINSAEKIVEREDDSDVDGGSSFDGTFDGID